MHKGEVEIHVNMTMMTAEHPRRTAGRARRSPFYPTQIQLFATWQSYFKLIGLQSSEPISHFTLVGLLVEEPSSHFTIQADWVGHVEPTESASYWPITRSSR